MPAHRQQLAQAVLDNAGEQEDAPPAMPDYSKAGDEAAISSTQDSSVADSVNMENDAGGLQLGLGLIVGVAPRYMGSKSSMGLIAPFINASWGPFFADFQKGIGVGYQTGSGLEASLSFAPDPGRTEKNEYLFPGSERLRGMGKIDAAFMATLSLRQQLGQTFAISGDYSARLEKREQAGDQYRLGLELMPLPMLGIERSRDEVSIGLDVHGGDEDYNQAYFGVTPAQSVRTGRFAAHAVRSGFNAASLSLNWQRALDDHWALLVSGEARRFVGDAADSPIVERRTNVTIGAGVMYTF